MPPACAGVYGIPKYMAAGRTRLLVRRVRKRARMMRIFEKVVAIVEARQIADAEISRRYSDDAPEKHADEMLQIMQAEYFASVYPGGGLW